jgi:hypothetical protein
VKTYKNDLKQHFLVYLHEFLIPLLNVGGLLAGIGIVIGSSLGIILVMFAPLDNFLQDRLVDLCDSVNRRSERKPKRGGGMLTLGIGIADSRSPPPRSSSMFLMSIDRSATSRSVNV